MFLCFALIVSMPSVFGAASLALDEGAVHVFAGTGRHGADSTESVVEFNLPGGIAGLPGGYLLVADTFNNIVRSLTDEGLDGGFFGTVEIAARDSFPMGFYRDGEGAYAGFRRPMDVAVREDGYVFVADSLNHSIRVGVEGRFYTFVGGRGSGHADGAAHVARFNSPSAIAICPRGNIYVADTLNHVVRRIDANGNTTTVAGRPGSHGYSGGRGTAVRFDSPMGIAVAEDGRIFVADTGNNVIRVIQNGLVSTFAGTMSRVGVRERDGHADGWGLNAVGGFRDGRGAEARFSAPVGLAMWNGNIIVADSGNHSIRMVDGNGVVTTLGGNGYPGIYEDGAALFHLPRGVYVRGDYLYIADTGNNMIRRMPLSQ